MGRVPHRFMIKFLSLQPFIKGIEGLSMFACEHYWACNYFKLCFANKARLLLQLPARGPGPVLGYERIGPVWLRKRKVSVSVEISAVQL